MSVGWHDLDTDGQAVAEAVFAALDQTATLKAAATKDAGETRPSPSMLWAWVTGRLAMQQTLAAALRRYPGIGDEVAALFDRVAVATLPRVAAAATGNTVAHRAGGGAVVRLLPSRASTDQTYVMITVDDPDRVPSQLIAVSGDHMVMQALDPPVGGAIQMLVETASDLVGVLADTQARVWLL